MPSIDTFLQTAYQFIKALFVRVTKRMYRTAAVLMTGAAVVTVIAFNSVSFGGVGKNAASAHREYPDDVELTEMLQSEETTETESLSEFTILASNEESQHLLGQRLEQGIQDELAKESISASFCLTVCGQCKKKARCRGHSTISGCATWHMPPEKRGLRGNRRMLRRVPMHSFRDASSPVRIRAM